MGLIISELASDSQNKECKMKEKNDIIETVTKKVRENGSVSIYQEEMIKCFDLWSGFDYTDWLKILNNIKNHPLRLYAFFPFMSRIIGIEILHEFRSLKGVKDMVLNYIGEGKGISMYTIDMGDVRFYAQNEEVIDKIYNSIDKLKKQGAIPVQSYTLYYRRHNGELIQKYKKTIVRQEFTMLQIGEICQDKYLYDQREIVRKE